MSTVTTGKHHTPLRRVANLVVWVVVVFNIAIFVWMFIDALRSNKSIFDNPLGFDWPPVIENFINAWSNSNFGPAALNTAIVAIGGALAVVLISAPAAFVLARSERKFSGTMLLYFAAGLGVPIQVIIIPVFMIMAKVELINSLPGLILVYVGTGLPFTLFLLAGFFRSLPDELEEAAALDGASGLRAFFSIMLPLARSGMITAFLLNIISMWSETFIALVFITEQAKQTLPLALLGFRASMQYSGSDYGQLFAGLCILVLPMIALYCWLGSRIIEGMTLGASK